MVFLNVIISLNRMELHFLNRETKSYVFPNRAEKDTKNKITVKTIKIPQGLVAKWIKYGFPKKTSTAK